MGTALAITAIGMTLLFLTLAFFYGLLSFMASAIEDRPSGSNSVAVAPPAAKDQEAALRAAAIAVALARANTDGRAVSTESPLQAEPSPGASPWWALHHQRSLNPNLPVRRPR
jgi:Na+-transporting methylmalonyl-CoA/oxaloacetate decarboxylase gamma subunit